MKRLTRRYILKQFVERSKKNYNGRIARKKPFINKAKQRIYF